MTAVAGRPHSDFSLALGRMPGGVPESPLGESDSEPVRLRVEAAVEDDSRDAERLELGVVTREPDAAVEPAVRAEELEGLLWRERRVPAGLFPCCLQLVVVVDAAVMDSRLENGQLEHPARRSRVERGVRLVARVSGSRRERLDDQVERDEDDEDAAEPHELVRPAPQQLGAGEGGEGRDGEVGDGEEAAGDSCEMERREVAPEGLVAGEVRPQRQHDGDDRRETQQDREGSAPARQQNEPDERQGRRQPAEVDELLAPGPMPAVEEVERLCGVVSKLGHGTAAFLRRAGDQRVADQRSDADRRQRPS